jgi:hypothetical protein
MESTMWNLIMFVLTVLSIIWTWQLINFAIKTANRIAISSELTAATMLALYDGLSDEAKARSQAASAERAAKLDAALAPVLRKQTAKQAASLSFRDSALPALVILGTLVIIFIGSVFGIFG